MTKDSAVTFFNRPELTDGTMLVALTGWMDGGLVSTGTVARLMENRTLVRVATIDPEPFYIYNFPGSMEIAAMFRPTVKYEEGLVSEIDLPQNVFQADPQAKLAFFIGKEPNLRWQSFADAIFRVAEALQIRRIIFIGSFGGTVPHTREPRMYGSVSHQKLRPLLQQHGVRMSDYEGPAGFSTLLLAQSAAHGIEMLSLVAEIPGYLEGINPLSIEAVSRRLAALLEVHVDMDSLRKTSNEWELQVTQAVEKNKDLAKTVRKLEEEYDNELIDEAPAE